MVAPWTLAEPPDRLKPSLMCLLFPPYHLREANSPFIHPPEPTQALWQHAHKYSQGRLLGSHGNYRRFAVN